MSTSDNFQSPRVNSLSAFVCMNSLLEVFRFSNFYLCSISVLLSKPADLILFSLCLYSRFSRFFRMYIFALISMVCLLCLLLICLLPSYYLFVHWQVLIASFMTSDFLYIVLLCLRAKFSPLSRVISGIIEFNAVVVDR